MKKLNIYLCLNSVKHLKDKSYYNRNYYELEPYGDWCIFFNGNNIVEAVCHEDEDYYTEVEVLNSNFPEESTEFNYVKGTQSEIKMIIKVTYDR